MKNVPDVLVFLTDGCGQAPATQPKKVPHVIWVLCGEHKQVPFVYEEGDHSEVSWGKIIEIDSDESAA
jgi:predicted metal-dependent peptidase